MRVFSITDQNEFLLDVNKSLVGETQENEAQEGKEYSDDLRWELARNSSAEAQSFFSISV
jgi:hypothetical protein